MGIKRQKIAFTTVLNDEYIEGAKVALYSLIKSNPGFNYDVKILDWGELSLQNKEKLLKIYDNIEFIPVITKDYNLCLFGDQMRKWTYNCNYRFDIFLLTEYDKIVFFDCDFLFQTNLTSLLRKNIDFGAVESKKEYIPQLLGEKCFSAGFMIIGKKFINSKTREELIKLSLSPAPKSHLNTILWSSDEPILNNYFINHTTFISKKYNTLIYNLTPRSLNEGVNIHFNGVNKPWNSKNILDVFDKFSLNIFLNKYGSSLGLLSLNKIIKHYQKSLSGVNGL